MNLRKEFNQNSCSNCGSTFLIWDDYSGEITCHDCGVVLKIVIYTGSETTGFTPDGEPKKRTGLPMSFSVPDKGLATMISKIVKDAHGNTLPPETIKKMFRLKKWQQYSINSQNYGRNLNYAMAHIRTTCDILHLPYIIKEKAALIYRQALKKGLVRGRSIEGIADASIYAVCRMNNLPISLKEIEECSIEEKRDIARNYRLILEKLHLKPHPPEAIRIIIKTANNLGISLETQQQAAEIIEKAKQMKITQGKNPISLAAATLYLACLIKEEKMTQKILSEATGISQVSIRNRYTELRDKLYCARKFR
jgi:transcription initiation factor TFIIB